MSKQLLQKGNLRRVGFLAAAIMFVFGVESNVSAQTTAIDPPATTTTTIGGVQVRIDPQTGRLRPPTPEEVKALTEGIEQMLSRSTEGLEVVGHPEGYESVDLQGRFMNLSVAKRKSDGTIVKECVTSIEEAKAFLNTDINADASGSAVAARSSKRATEPVSAKPVSGAATKKAPTNSKRKARKASRKD